MGYRTYDAYVEKTLENDLLLENAEALADNEGQTTYTTWNCDGATIFPCGASCESCRISVSGTGKLTGEHRCSR